MTSMEANHRRSAAITLPQLGYDVLLQILTRLSPVALGRLAQTCQEMSGLTRDETLWMRLCEADFRVMPSQTFRNFGWKTLYSRLAHPAVFTWGESQSGVRAGPINVPGRVATLNHSGISQICCLGWSMLALSRDGRAYLWGTLNPEGGWDSDGSWNGRSTRPFPFPTEVDTGLQFPGDRIAQIAGSRGFGVLRMDSGNVLALTEMESAKGLKVLSQQHTTELGRVTRVAAGWTHALALTDRNKILEWHAGRNYSFDLKVNDDHDWVGVAGGEGFTVGLTRAGDVYKWQDGHDSRPVLDTEISGRGYTHISAAFRHHALFRRGKKGDPSKVSVFSTAEGKYSPVSLPDDAPAGDQIVEISFGDWHAAILTQQGHVYTWGGDGGGQLGQGTHRQNVLSPKLVEQLRDDGWFVFQIACGGWHTACLAVRLQ